jgi:predicted solute-binding protein
VRRLTAASELVGSVNHLNHTRSFDIQALISLLQILTENSFRRFRLGRIIIRRMLVKGKAWEIKAAAKRSSTLAKIPKEWLLDSADLEKASRQRDLTGAFIEQYLSAEEIIIVRQDSVSIVTSLHKGEYSTVQVTRAFCKAAAIAHQIVSSF